MVDDVPRAQVWTATVDPAGRTFSLNASIVLPNGLLKSFNAPKSVGKDDATTLVTLAVCVGSVLAKAPGATSQQCVTALGLDVLIRAAISAFDTPPYRMSAAPARVTQGASVQVPIEVQFQPDFGGPVADFEIDGGTETYKAKGLKLEFDRYAPAKPPVTPKPTAPASQTPAANQKPPAAPTVTKPPAPSPVKAPPPPVKATPAPVKAPPPPVKAQPAPVKAPPPPPAKPAAPAPAKARR